MKLDFNRRYTTIAFYAFLVLSGAGLFAAFLQNFPFFKGFFLQIFTLLRPFIYGFGIAYILNPVLKFVESILAEFSGSYISSKPRRAIAICLTYLLAAGVIAIFIMIMLPQLVNSVTGLVNRMVTFLNSTNRDVLMNYILSFSSDMDISTALWGLSRFWKIRSVLG